MRASDISRGRQILLRFLALAEERLAYLTELYETGRWQRYFTQAELIENVRDAKKAVDAWTLLVSTEALPNNRPVDLGWLNHGRPLPLRQHLLPDVQHRQLSARFTAPLPEPQFAAVALDPLPLVAEAMRIDQLPTTVPARIAALPSPTVATTAPKSAAEPPKPASWQNSLDFALMRDRYPLLRKTG